MPIPNAELAVVRPEKAAEYLLNIFHPVGGSKAPWFVSLGYDPSRPERLAHDLLDVVRRCDAVSIHKSEFGVKHDVPGPVATPSGRSVNVVTVWIMQPNDPHPRLVTAYPGTRPSDE
jgi:hypothetical protein